MYWDVVSVNIIKHLEFNVTFSDGLSGRVRMLPSHLFGVFARLKDPGFFKPTALFHGPTKSISPRTPCTRRSDATASGSLPEI